MDYVKFTTNEAVPKLHIYKLNTEASIFLHQLIEDFDYSGIGVQPKSQQIIATWLVLDGNAYSPGDDAAKLIIPYDLCEKGSKVKTTGFYQIFLTSSGTAHVYETGWCFAFGKVVWSDSIYYFEKTNAPDPASVSAITWATSTPLLGAGNHLIAFESAK
jgi:hypothetical protein